MESQYEYEDEMEIDLEELFFLLLHAWKRIVFSAFFFAVVVAIINQMLLTPQYESTAKLYVIPKTEDSNLADIQAGTSLTQDYLDVVQSRPVLEEVIENLKLDQEYKELVKKVSVENPTDTRVLEITVRDTDPSQAKKIVDGITEVSTDFIAERMNQDKPNILQLGYVDSEPVTPKTKRNTCIGFMAGGFMMSLFILINHMLNDTISDAEMIEKYLGLNTLAEIPEINQKRKKKTRGRGK